ncbi:hypothetical protein JOC85_002518 [Bacillus mesophilus]|uniref:Uncharacterized protein n=1 Tax=Bacillus mesophilus TaxID=1808955 RepID=A0A6M0Q7P2_9BACI|nr:hypothetical protein [Bacillus mesophilus]MBM7661715.1 hypothetical protein [Bacillus mesophilus]NEY72375.1 hypothetical protein [Bacillus mesophilus]
MKLKDIKNIIYQSEDKELLNFINDHFAHSKNKRVNDYKNNLDLLKRLDKDTIRFAIARMKKSEHNNDLTILSPVITILLSIFTLASSVLAIQLRDLVYLAYSLSLIMILAILTQIIRLIPQVKSRKLNAILFRSLLEDIEKEKKS